jgi:valyl-tRNA synthetase
VFPVDGCEIFVPLEGVIDLEAEATRLRSEIATVENGLAAIAKKLDSPGFLERAPAAVVAGEQARKEALQLKLESLQLSLKDLG